LQDLAGLVVRAQHAAVREVPDDRTHRGILITGEALDAPKSVQVLDGAVASF
jgi:hypothetical protein